MFRLFAVIAQHWRGCRACLPRLFAVVVVVLPVESATALPRSAVSSFAVLDTVPAMREDVPPVLLHSAAGNASDQEMADKLQSLLLAADGEDSDELLAPDLGIDMTLAGPWQETASLGLLQEPKLRGLSCSVEMTRLCNDVLRDTPVASAGPPRFAPPADAPSMLAEVAAATLLMIGLGGLALILGRGLLVRRRPLEG